MNELPKAVKQPDGTLLIPAQTATLLHRVLGEVWQTLAVQQAEAGVDHARELAALDAIKALLGPTGRLPRWGCC